MRRSVYFVDRGQTSGCFIDFFCCDVLLYRLLVGNFVLLWRLLLLLLAFCCCVFLCVLNLNYSFCPVYFVDGGQTSGCSIDFLCCAVRASVSSFGWYFCFAVAFAAVVAGILLLCIFVCFEFELFLLPCLFR